MTLTESAVHKLTSFSDTSTSQKGKGKLSSFMPHLRVPKVHPFGKKDGDEKSQVCTTDLVVAMFKGMLTSRVAPLVPPSDFD